MASKKDFFKSLYEESSDHGDKEIETFPPLIPILKDARTKDTSTEDQEPSVTYITSKPPASSSSASCRASKMDGPLRGEGLLSLYLPPVEDKTSKKQTKKKSVWDMPKKLLPESGRVFDKIYFCRSSRIDF